MMLGNLEFCVYTVIKMIRSESSNSVFFPLFCSPTLATVITWFGCNIAKDTEDETCIGWTAPWLGGQTDTGGEILREAQRASPWDGLLVPWNFW